ncbi:MAG: hypothetical protein RBS99_11790 [Rhodospirillales bacterium]|jgi:hypothetical protein|nr:hypothetical protein [Rhodospirillales bacterium]
MERQFADLESQRFPSRFAGDNFSLAEKDAARLQREVTQAMAASLWRGVRMAGSVVGRFFVLVAKAAAAMRVYNEMSRLDDSTLANLGLRRIDIPQFVAASMDGGAGRWPMAAPVAALRTVDGEAPSDTVADNDLTQRRAA